MRENRTEENDMTDKQAAAKTRIDARRANNQRLINEHTARDRAALDQMEATPESEYWGVNPVGIGTN